MLLNVEEFIFGDESAEKDEEDEAGNEEEADGNDEEAVVNGDQQNEEEKVEEVNEVGLGNEVAQENSETNEATAENDEAKNEEDRTNHEAEHDAGQENGAPAEKETEDDSINLMIGDEDKMFEEDSGLNGVPGSPPRPETAPVAYPFTSKDAIRNYERFLAPEKWQEILVNVSPVDLCNVMRASSYMNSLASRQDLWAGMPVNMEMVRQNGLTQLFSIERFKKITKMDFSGSHFTSEELERVISEVPGSPLENVDLSNNNLSQIPPHLLANTVSHLKSVNLRSTNLTTQQCVKIMEASISSTKLVNMNLGFINLREVHPDLLAKAICGLQIVGLEDSRLTTQQLVKLLEASLLSTTLVNMNLGYINLREVHPDLLAKAICGLQTVDLANSRLTTQQLVKLLEASISSTMLVNMSLGWGGLGGVNLREVQPDLLAKAICRLQTVNLCFTLLTTQQLVKLLEASLLSTTLVNMNLRMVDLREVHPDLLAKAICRLQTVDLDYSCLTTQQLVKLLEASLLSTTLVNMNLRMVDLREVQPDLLARARLKYELLN